MSRETEKILKELQHFLDSHADEIESEGDANVLAEQFLAEYDQTCVAQKDYAPETADDYLELAEQAMSKKKCVEYLRKALELEPESVDVQLQLIVHTLEGKSDKQLPALQKIMDSAAKQLEQEGCFQEDVGAFWDVLETRPYMRVCYTYFESLIA